MRTRLLPALLLIFTCCSRGTDTAGGTPTWTQQPAANPTTSNAAAGVAQRPIEPLSPAPIRMGDGVVAPVVIKRIDPNYEACKGQELWGFPILEAVIDERGSVQNAHLLKEVHPCLAAVVLEAVRQWKFRPGTLNGKPVAVYYNMTIHINYR